MYRCPECKGTNVLESMWMDANTEEITDQAGQEPWCNDCDEHVRRLEFVEEKPEPEPTSTFATPKDALAAVVAITMQSLRGGSDEGGA